MQNIAVAICLVNSIFFMYINSLWSDLYRLHIIDNTKKISLRCLNAALKSETDPDGRELLLKCLKLYKIFLVIFYFNLALLVGIFVNVALE